MTLPRIPAPALACNDREGVEVFVAGSRYDVVPSAKRRPLLPAAHYHAASTSDALVLCGGVVRWADRPRGAPRYNAMPLACLKVGPDAAVFVKERRYSAPPHHGGRRKRLPGEHEHRAVGHKAFEACNGELRWRGFPANREGRRA